MKSKDFFESAIKIITNLAKYSGQTLDENHPLYRHKVFCENALKNNGIIKLENEGIIERQIAQILLDCIILINQTEGDLRKFALGEELRHTKNTKKKFRTRISNTDQYSGLIIELYTYAWHVLCGHKTELWERKGLPDIYVEYSPAAYPLLISCTHRDEHNLSPEYFRKKLDKAEEQINHAGELYGNQHCGVLLIDISIPVGINCAKDDSLPIGVTQSVEEVGRLLITGEYKHINSIILVWDDCLRLEISNQLSFALRRRSKIISADNHDALPLFEGYDSFVNLKILKKQSNSEGYTDGYYLNEIMFSKIPRTYAWFKAISYGLADQLMTYKYEEKE